MALAGGTGSGKTTLAHALQAAWPETVGVIAYDWYYRDYDSLSFAERSVLDFDTPEALDTPLLITHLNALKRGASIQAPQYDFNTHARMQKTLEVHPKPILVVEGIHALSDAQLRQLYDWSVYLDVPEELRLQRRLERDTTERGRSREAALTQYEQQTRPNHVRYVVPCKTHAALVLTESNDVAVAVLKAHLQGMLSTK